MKPGEVEGGVGDVDVGGAHGEDRSACLQVTWQSPKMMTQLSVRHCTLKQGSRKEGLDST